MKPLSPFWILVWEDGVLTALTVLWVLTGAGMDLFHYFTVALMALVLFLSLRQGALAGLVRTAVVAVAVFVFKSHSEWSHHSVLAELTVMSGCGVLAAVLGGRERKARETLQESFSQTLVALARALEARDSYTEGHSKRVADYAVAIAKQMDLSDEAQRTLSQAGRLHDLGKIGASDAVLQKKTSLTPEEKRQMSLHPLIGEQILSGIPFLAEASALVRHHHEHYDGSGYPDGLAGSAIPLGARILTVADVLDALTTDRSYHQAMSRPEAIDQMERDAGRLFDPLVLRVLKEANLGGVHGK